MALDPRYRQDTLVAREAQISQDLRERRITGEEAGKRRAALAGERYDVEEHLGQRQQRLPGLQAEQEQAQRQRASGQIDLDAEKAIAEIRSRGLDSPSIR